MARNQPRQRAGRGADPRLVIGIVLVAGSAAGMWALITSLDASAEVYTVRDTVTAGSTITPADLVAKPVQLGAAVDRYVTPGRVPRDGLLVTRTIDAGELVPRSAVTDLDDLERATVVVTTSGALARGLGPGSLVDIWSAAPLEGGGFATPSVLVASAEISEIVERGALPTGGEVQVELRVTHDQVGPILSAQAAGASIDVVTARLDGER